MVSGLLGLECGTNIELGFWHAGPRVRYQHRAGIVLSLSDLQAPCCLCRRPVSPAPPSSSSLGVSFDQQSWALNSVR
eukprot:7658765-Pyramimonas_sp.AAC.1